LLDNAAAVISKTSYGLPSDSLHPKELKKDISTDNLSLVFTPTKPQKGRNVLCRNLAGALTILLALALTATALAAPLKPRIVVLTDRSPITAAPDDFKSSVLA
jgi:hypothetical protein